MVGDPSTGQRSGGVVGESTPASVTPLVSATTVDTTRHRPFQLVSHGRPTSVTPVKTRPVCVFVDFGTLPSSRRVRGGIGIPAGPRGPGVEEVPSWWWSRFSGRGVGSRECNSNIPYLSFFYLHRL